MIVLVISFFGFVSMFLIEIVGSVNWFSLLVILLIAYLVYSSVNRTIKIIVNDDSTIEFYSILKKTIIKFDDIKEIRNIEHINIFGALRLPNSIIIKHRKGSVNFPIYKGHDFHNFYLYLTKKPQLRKLISEYWLDFIKKNV